jgi:Lrp/AsnC family leucine-responsive transcriptional regulator
MTSRLEKELDDLDWHILDELQADARLSYKELSRRVNLSPPAVAERVRRLEEAGVITGYHAHVDARRAGHAVAAFVEMKCAPGACLLKTSAADEFPEIVEIHKLTGDRCAMVRVRAGSLDHFEGLLERLGWHGEIRSSVVLSTEYEGRPVEPPVQDYMPATRHAGWTR